MDGMKLILLISLVGSACAIPWDQLTPLDQYVQGDDGHYSWTEIASYNYRGVTLYVVNMTSQMYQTDEFSTQSIWWHYMGIAIPDEITHPGHGILFINGGGNTNYNPPAEDDFTGIAMAVIANDTGIITAYVSAVPNQPIYFKNDPTNRRRSEDSIIAWTWRTYLDAPEPSDPTVILRMPMTKSAKRALDTITAVSSIRAPETDVREFFVTGASKRGWTTWSLAATDQRVVGIIPMVFSMLNMDDGEGSGTIMKHNQNMDGDWSFAFEPYWNEGLTTEFYNPKTLGIWAVEDMYYYRERLTLPIMEMVSSGDEFFLCDDNYNWWNGIPDPKYLMMLPNAEHTMAPHYVQIYATAVSFVLSIVEGKELPTVTWEMGQAPDDGPGYIEFWGSPPPLSIKAYSAVTLRNDTRRDFRLAAGPPGEVAIHPVAWRQNLEIIPVHDGHYRVEAQPQTGEWVGFFLEGEWEGPSGYRLVLTSQINIIPNTYPRPVCADGPSCKGNLV